MIDGFRYGRHDFVWSPNSTTTSADYGERLDERLRCSRACRRSASRRTERTNPSFLLTRLWRQRKQQNPSPKGEGFCVCIRSKVSYAHGAQKAERTSSKAIAFGFIVGAHRRWLCGTSFFFRASPQVKIVRESDIASSSDYEFTDPLIGSLRGQGRVNSRPNMSLQMQNPGSVPI